MNEEWNRDNSLNNLPEGTEHPGEENQKEDTIRSSESQINFTMRDSSGEEDRPPPQKRRMPENKKPSITPTIFQILSPLRSPPRKGKRPFPQEDGERNLPYALALP